MSAQPYDRFVAIRVNVHPDEGDERNALYGLYEIEDTSQPHGEKRVLARGVRFAAARMIVAALNHAV